MFVGSNRFVGLERWKTQLTMTLILVIMTSASVSFSASLDPLLKGLLQTKSNDGPGMVYENFLVIDASKNANDPHVAVILHLDGFTADLAQIPGLVVGSQTGAFITADIPLSSLPMLEDNDDISYVEAAYLQHTLMDMATVDGKVDQVWNGAPAYTGAGVLVGVIDSGIDWNHADFQTAGGDTRIKYIWDQYVSGTNPDGFDYGAEYNEIQINAGNLTEQDLSGHGTHVAGMAAGNGLTLAGLYSGVAPEADIIFAKAYDDQQHGFPETKTIDAMNYLAGKAATLEQPIAINMSLGGHMGAHDGTSAQEQIVDDLSGTGVVFCIAGGNEGEASRHHSGPASGTNIVLNIPSYPANPGTGNDYVYLSIWVDGAGSPSVSVTCSGTTTGPVLSGNVEGLSTANGAVVIDNASGGINPANGDKQILIQVNDSGGVSPAAGDWTINISNGTGTAHAWIGASTMLTAFPDSDQSHSVGMPGTSEKAITVAAHKTRHFWDSYAGGTYSYGGTWGAAAIGDHAPFSSLGPTRDGREKPDISAPGLGIFAPYSEDTTPYPGGTWLDTSGNYLLSSGTSMATPFVCGVVALLFEKNSTLNSDQIKEAIRSTAVVDGFTGGVWNNRFGAGKVDALAAIGAISTPAPPPTGDVNDDGDTSVLDLVLLVNYIVDPVGHPLDTDARTQGDVYPSPNGDGVLNASDLARMVDFILESDEPGYAAPQMNPIAYQIGQATWQDGRWWQPVNITGAGMAAGQFALNLEGASWHPQDLICDDDVQVVASDAGAQLRVLLYDLDAAMPSDGISLLIPFDHPAEQPAQAINSGLLMVDATGSAMMVEEIAISIAGYLQISPNPARNEMLVSFSKNSGREFGLTVFDIRGRRVRGVMTGLGADGPQKVIFDGRDDSGRLLPAGVYFMQLRSGEEVISRKIVLTR